MEKIIEQYIKEHPDYWEFENEAKVVAKLREACDEKSVKHNFSEPRHYSQKGQ